MPYGMSGTVSPEQRCVCAVRSLSEVHRAAGDEVLPGRRGTGARDIQDAGVRGRCLHSFNFQLNLSRV